MTSVLEKFPVASWSTVIGKRKDSLLKRLSLDTTPVLLKRVVVWNPRDCEAYNDHFARKSAGHPRCTWEDR